jgi:hypothetical protein
MLSRAATEMKVHLLHGKLEVPFSFYLLQAFPFVKTKPRVELLSALTTFS